MQILVLFHYRMVEAVVIRADGNVKRFVVKQATFVAGVNVQHEIADGNADADVFVGAGARENAERQILNRKIRVRAVG